MEESILMTIKKMLGGSLVETDHFDMDIIININSVLMQLGQLGIGPPEGFIIEDEYAIWSEFLLERKDLIAVQAYIYLKVKQVFDPPTSSFVLDSVDRQIKELEWRLNVQAEHKPVGGVEDYG